MKNKRAAYGFVLTVLAMSGGLTAEAAVQTQTQTTYTSQTQKSEATGSSSMSQNQTSTMSTNQTESSNTQTPGANVGVQNTNKSSIAAAVDQSVTSSGGNQQTETDRAQSSQNKTTTTNSVQIANTNRVSSSQNHDTSTSTSASTQMSQDSASLIQSTQVQLLRPNSSPLPQNDSTSTSNSHVQSVSNIYRGPDYYLRQSIMQLQSTYDSAQIAGYAVFDMSGNLLSDAYGIFPNSNNNSTKKYDTFAPQASISVIIAAVNAYGQPIVSPGTTTLYLRSNNASSSFLDASNQNTIHSIVLPAGSSGVVVGYLNGGGGSSYDVLDAGVDNPALVRHSLLKEQSHGIETQQSQQANFVQGANSQSQNNLLASGQMQDSNAPVTTQEAGSQQNSDATQFQSLAVPNSTLVQENQHSVLSSEQNIVNQGSSNETLSGVSTQSESASLTGLTSLSQNQSVSVKDSVINITFAQNSANDGSSVSLNQSIGVHDSSAPVAPTSGTVVNVTLGSDQKQWVVNADSPITFNESQTVAASNPAAVQESISMVYTSGGKKNTVTIS